MDFTKRNVLLPIEVLQYDLDQCIADMNALNDFNISEFCGNEIKIETHAKQIKDCFSDLRNQMTTP